MKRLVIILFLCSSISWSQKMYNSTHTIHFPSEDREDISKTITINNEHILIKSYQGNEGIHSQLLLIKKETEDLFADGWSKSYHCVTSNENISYIVRIKKENPDAIIVIQPSTDETIAKVHKLVLKK